MGDPEQPLRQLRQLHQLHRVGRLLQGAIGGDSVTFTRIRHAQGVPTVHAINLEPERQSAITVVDNFNAIAASHYTPPFDYSLAPHRERSHFVDEIELFGPDPVSTPFFERYLLPAGIRHQLRTLIFDGDRILGLVVVARGHHTAPFTARDRRAGRSLHARILADVVAYERSNAPPKTTADLVVDAAGDVDFTSATGDAWLAHPGCRDDLRRLVQIRSAGWTTMPVLAATGLASVCHVVGKNGERWLIRLEATTLIKARQHLPPRQRELARLLLDGQSLSGAAAALGIGRETAKEHLRRLYQTLEVSNRVELLRNLEAIFRDEPPAPGGA